MKTPGYENSLPVSRGKKIAFWACTGLVLLETAVGSFWDLFQIPFVLDVFKHLGYPAYLLIYLGIAKLLAVIVFFVQGLPRLKEWVYAGLFFTYTGAVFSHLAMSEYAEAVSPIVLAVLTLVSWVLQPLAFSRR